MGQISPSTLSKIDKWLYSGNSLEGQNLRIDQQFRARICYECYQRWLQNKQISARTTLKNIARREYALILQRAEGGDAQARELVRLMNIQHGVPRTPAELANDVMAFNHIIAVFTVDETASQKARYIDGAEWLMREGMKQNDARAVKAGMDALANINDNFKDKDDAAGEMPNADLNITSDISIIKTDRVNIDEEEKQRFFRRLNVTEREVNVLIESSDGSWSLPDEAPDEEPEPDIYEQHDHVHAPLPDPLAAPAAPDDYGEIGV